jgi:hypothetical protein
MEEQTEGLVTVAQLLSPTEANVLRACLESRGIFAYIWGEHVAAAQVILPTTGGSARVQVRADQLAQAREVIAALDRGDLAIPQPQPPDGDGELPGSSG